MSEWAANQSLVAVAVSLPLQSPYICHPADKKRGVIQMCHFMNKSNIDQKEQTKNYSFILQQNVLPQAN